MCNTYVIQYNTILKNADLHNQSRTFVTKRRSWRTRKNVPITTIKQVAGFANPTKIKLLQSMDTGFENASVQ